MGSARNTPFTPNPTSGSSRVRGRTIMIFLRSEKKIACFKSISLSSFTFDSSVFEIVDGQWKIEDAVIANYNTANKTAVATVAEDTDINGIIFELTLKIKDDAPAGDYDISCTIAAKKKSPAGGEENVKIALTNFTYDTSVFELVGGEWRVDESIIADWDDNNDIAAVAFGDNQNVNGIIFELTFKVIDPAKEGDYYVGCDIIARSKTPYGAEDQVPVKVTNGKITVSPVIKGDTDGNGVINSDDAIYLLYHTFLPDMFPANQDCDFDGNGYINSDDAIYLLYYTFLPDLFPLK